MVIQIEEKKAKLAVADKIDEINRLNRIIVELKNAPPREIFKDRIV
jgi:hypothetical protein